MTKMDEDFADEVANNFVKSLGSLTPKVSFKLYHNFLQSDRASIESSTHTSHDIDVTDPTRIVENALQMYLYDKVVEAIQKTCRTCRKMGA